MAATSTFAQEYGILTSACGLVDRSERGKLALTGTAAKDFLQGQLTNDMSTLTPGSGLYAAFLTQKGKMQGDVRLLDTGPELLLDTERVALQALFNMIRSFSLGHDVLLHKRTLESGLFALIGPEADALVQRAGIELAAAEHSHLQLTVAGAQVRAIRTHLGIDLLFAAEHRQTVLDAILAMGATAVGEEAAECLRIESGRPRYGVDLNESVIPQEAGLNERAVSFTKGCYVGQETVARLYYKGKPNRELRGLRSEEPLPVGAALHFAGREVGTVTSSSVSPRLGPLALALVRREAPIGSITEAEGGQTAVVSALPFANAS